MGGCLFDYVKFDMTNEFVYSGWLEFCGEKWKVFAMKIQRLCFLSGIGCFVKLTGFALANVRGSIKFSI